MTAHGVVELHAPAAHDVRRVGSKAATLARLRAAGEPVPDALIALPDADPETAARAAIHRFGDQPLAVRSSSLQEDLARSSGAGRYLTLLQVRGAAAIAAAIASVRESGDDGPSCPVLLMPMVPAAAAGVAFTVNPVTGDDEVVIEAVVGLGDALMAGTATPQRYTAVGHGPARAHAEDPAAITPQQATAIAVVARRLAAQLKTPLDMEWAIADGEIHVLQARPITALPQAPGDPLPGRRERWERADQHYAHPVRPLEFSVWAPRFEATASKVFAEVGAPLETMRYRVIRGWMYLRIVPLMDQGKDDQAAPPALLFGIVLRIIPVLRTRLARAAHVWHSDVPREAARSWERGGREGLRDHTRRLRTTDLVGLDDQGLAAHFEQVLAHVQDASDVHFRLPVLATFLPTGRLGVLTQRLLGWGPVETMRLLRGFAQVRGSAAALDSVMDAFSADAEARALLEDASPAVLNASGPAAERLRAFIDVRGHQVVGMDLAHPTWAEDPRPLLAILRARLAGSAPPVGRDDTAAEAEREARRLLADRPGALADFDETLAAARRGASYGDDTEQDVLDALGLVRYVAVEAGHRLQASGRLERADDVLYLHEDELLAALRGEPLAADIARRRGEHQWAKAHPGPRWYGPEPSPAPDLRWTPRRVRPFLEAMTWAIEQMAGMPVASDATTVGLAGLAASPGRATGAVRVISTPAEFDRIEPGDVLVCPSTTASWSMVFPLLAAIVTESGGPLSHPAILAREFGVPAVLGVSEATTLLMDGQIVTVDGTTGMIDAGVAARDHSPTGGRAPSPHARDADGAAGGSQRISP